MAGGEDDRHRVCVVAADPDRATTVARRLAAEDASIAADSTTEASAVMDDLAALDCVVALDASGATGLDGLRRVRDRDPDVPVVLAPRDGSEALASEAVAVGVSAYVPLGADGEGLETLADRVVDAIRRAETDDADQLRRVTAVLKDVAAALVRADGREEIEREVCEILASSVPYQFAWIGSYDAEEHSLTPTAHAGGAEAYLDVLPVGEGETLPEEGPGPETLESGEVRVSQNVRVDESMAPYRDGAAAHDLRSVATVPIVHDETTYGLLAVYADRTNAFGTEERALLASIGQDIGHAIAAIETRTALRRFRQAVASAGQAVAITTEDGTIEYVNPAFEAQTGYDPAAVVGRKLADVLDVSPGAVSEERAGDGGSLGWERELIATRAAGEDYHAEQTITPIEGRGGETVGFVLVQADVTDRIEREEALRTEKETLDGVFQTSPIGIVVLSPEGTIERANERAAEILGIEPSAIVGRRYDDPALQFVDEDGDPLPEEAHPVKRAAAASGSYADELRFRRPDGEVVWLSVRGAARTDGSGAVEGTVFTFSDVTEKKARERELRSFEKALEHAGHAVYITDVDGTIEWVNPAFVEQTGYDRAEAIGETPDLLNSGVHDEAFFAELWETVLSGEVWEREIVNERKDGTHVHVEQSIAPVLGDDGEIERFVAINRDVTERKEYEQRLERQNERLEEFASVVSHDLRNPLNVAEGRVALAREDSESEHLAAAASALSRMDAIVADVLTLAREGGSVDETGPVALETVARSAWAHVDTEGMSLAIEDPPTVVADETRLCRILENLFRNVADHAVGEGADPVTVRVGATADGFSVADDGPGVDPAIRDRVFDSGYTDSDAGTGLGLAIVERLAEAHGWTVELAESESGGARFAFRDVDSPPADRSADDSGRR